MVTHDASYSAGTFCRGGGQRLVKRDSQHHSLLFSQSGEGLAAGQTEGAEMLCRRSSHIYPGAREEGQKCPILHALSLGSQNLRAVSNLKWGKENTASTMHESPALGLHVQSSSNGLFFPLSPAFCLFLKSI